MHRHRDRGEDQYPTQQRHPHSCPDRTHTRTLATRSTYDAAVRLRLRLAGPVVAAVVVLSPMLREPTNDTYPLSTYPMFAFDRGAEHTIGTAVEIGADGAAVRLSPKLIAGTDEVILASVTVKRSIASGEADQLCEEIAERLGPGRTVEVLSLIHI